MLYRLGWSNLFPPWANNGFPGGPESKETPLTISSEKLQPIFITFITHKLQMTIIQFLNIHFIELRTK